MNLYIEATKTENGLEVRGPKAFRGDTVSAHNYKSKPSDGSQTWEDGEVLDVESGWTKDEDGKVFVRYSYRVKLFRETKHRRGGALILHLNDDGIEKEA